MQSGKIGVEGRGIEPLTGPAPETASGTTRPHARGTALKAVPAVRLCNGGDLQRWRHRSSVLTEQHGNTKCMLRKH